MTLQNRKQNSVRSLFLKTHRIIGIFIGILLIIIGTTGSLLVFHDRLEASVHPQLTHVTPQGKAVSIDAIATSVHQADPNGEIEFILLPKEPEESLKVKVKSDERELAVFVNPYTGAILGWWGFENILTHFLLKIHMTLLAGKVGEIVVGICGLFLLILCLTGVTLWSGWKKLIPAFKIRWRSPNPILSYDLHQVSGIIAVIFLTFISLTGIFLVLAHNSQAFLSLFFDRPAEPQLVAVAPEAKPITIAEAIEIGDLELPNSQTTGLAFAEDERKITVQKKYPNDIFDGGLSSVAIDRFTGKVLAVQKVLQPSIGNRIAKLVVDLHFGTFGGLASRILYIFVGLSPSVLFITGLTMYRLRRRPKQTAKANRELIQR